MISRTSRHCRRKSVTYRLITSLLLALLPVIYSTCILRVYSSGRNQIQARYPEASDMRLIQPIYETESFLRSFEVASVVEHNKQYFDDYLHPTDTNFSALFKLFHPSKVNIVANSDIIFDNTIKLVSQINTRTVYALTRYDMTGKLFNVSYSQDTWVIRGEMNQDLWNNGNFAFSMGLRGCDNRLAWELNNAGYTVLNPSLSVKTYHIHCSTVRTYLLHNKPVVEPPYLHLQPTTIVP